MALVTLGFMVSRDSILALLLHNPLLLYHFQRQMRPTSLVTLYNRKLSRSGIFCRGRMAFFAGLRPANFSLMSNFVE
jgi:hypothetical protein